MAEQEIINSLDPRIRRQQLPQTVLENVPFRDGGQLATFEVFQQVKAGKPFEHVGIVHSSDADLAFLFAKEQFSRRGNNCENMFVVPTAAFVITEVTEGANNILDTLKNQDVEKDVATSGLASFELFYLKKRGKQHYHAGRVQANSPDEALQIAARELYASPCLNVWVCKTDDILFFDESDKDIWLTLPEKKYREAIAYKSQDKIDRFKQNG